MIRPQIRHRPGNANAVAVATALVVASCSQPEVGGPCQPFAVSGNAGEACAQQMYFPTGLAIDPKADTLYVSNGNADLRYAGGTVQAIDVRAFDCAYDYAASGAWPKRCESESLNRLRCAMDYASSNFTSVREGCDGSALGALFGDKNRARIGGAGLCRPDLLDPTITECDEQLLVAGALAAAGQPSQGVVRVGNFAGELQVQPRSGPEGSHRRLWVAVRGDPSITFVDISRTGEGGDVLLDCGDTSPASGLAPSCQNQRITVRDFHDAAHQSLPPNSPGANTPNAPGVGCDSSNADKCVPIPSEPFGVVYDEGRYDEAVCHDGSACRGDGSCADGRTCLRGETYQHVLVSHLLGGEVMLINAAAEKPTSTSAVRPTEAVVLDVRGVGFDADAAGRRGGFGLAARQPGNPRSLWYASSRVNPRIAVFRIGFSNIVLPFQVVPLTGPFNAGDDVRELVFDPCGAPGNPNAGCRAFAIQNRPPSLFTLDTRIDPRHVPAGVPQNTVADIVPVCQGPSHLAFRAFDGVPGVPGGSRRSRVYVLCYSANQMVIVDPDLAQLVDSVLIGRGPNEIAFNFGGGVDPPQDDVESRLPRLRAYVTNFLDNSISVVDLDPGSATENRVVARIGFTEPPRLQ